jgi:hypothetical protein
MKEPEAWKLMTFGMLCGILGWVAIIAAVVSLLR